MRVPPVFLFYVGNYKVSIYCIGWVVSFYFLVCYWLGCSLLARRYEMMATIRIGLKCEITIQVLIYTADCTFRFFEITRFLKKLSIRFLGLICSIHKKWIIYQKWFQFLMILNPLLIKINLLVQPFTYYTGYCFSSLRQLAAATI